MAAEPVDILNLAEAIADGRDVDWGTVTSTARTEAEKGLVEQLQLLAGVAGLHRGGPAEDEWDPSTGAEVPPPGWRWGALEIRERVGAGSFGTLYRASDPRLGRDVALKLLRGESTDDAGAAIIHEGRLLARVNHPHVITVYGADRHAGRVGIWMEFIEGRNLEDLIRQNGVFGAREAALIGEELCGALAAVHAQGLVHRDIKAHNVMREDGGRIVLMDFGAGQDRDSPASAGRRATGTPLYMAPELFRHEPATPSSDLYSLGVLLFRLVSGAYPVTGQTADDVRASHEQGRCQRLRDLRPDLPAGFIAAVERAISPVAADRFPSAGAMEAALAAAFQRPERRTVPRVRTVVAGIAVILIAGLAAVLVKFRGVIWPEAIRTIAVLPLQNLTGDSNQDYLVAGIGDLLLSRLMAVGPLRVIPPSSTARISEDPERASRAARDLRADYLLEGSVGRSNERIRLSVRLITAGTGAVHWAHTYERGMNDQFTVQGEIASAVANAVSVNVRAGQWPSASRLYTTSAEAQEAYLRGRYLLYRFDRSMLPDVRRAFEHAVALDPQFALAQASLARAYLMVESYGLATPAETRPLASNAARSAVALAPDLSEARIALAEVKFKAERDWEGAEAEYRAALDLTPNASVVRSPYSRFLSAAGRPGEALEHAEAGLAADPLSAEMMASVGITQYYLRRFDAAVSTFDRVVAMNPSYGPGFFGRARAKSARGEFEAAIADVKHALVLSGGEPSYQAELARVHAAAGWRNAAEQLLGELVDASRKGQPPVASQDLAWVYAALGDRDRALELLADALNVNHTRVLFLRVDPRADPVRDDIRFKKLLDTLGPVHR